MYRVRPYFEIKKVKLPDCMYLMKPLHQLPSMKASNEVRRELFYHVILSQISCAI